MLGSFGISQVIVEPTHEFPACEVCNHQVDPFSDTCRTAVVAHGAYAYMPSGNRSVRMVLADLGCPSDLPVTEILAKKPIRSVTAAPSTASNYWSCSLPAWTAPVAPDPWGAVGGFAAVTSHSASVRANEPFAIDHRPTGTLGRALWRLAYPAVARITALRKLREEYRHIARSAPMTPPEFCEAVLRRLGVTWDVPASDLLRVRPSGPLVVVANHPFGGLEGVILLALLSQVRSDVKVLANTLLDRIPDLREALIPIDPFGGPGSVERNVPGLRAALRWLSAGHALVVFPAGEVAHLDPWQRAVCEPAWSPTVARVIQRSGAPVLPVYLAGRNGNWFQLLGLVHPRLRTLLLPRELLNKRHRAVRMRIGTLIDASRLAPFEDATELVRYLKMRTLLLGAGLQSERERRAGRRPPVTAPVADPIPAATLIDQIRLLAGRRLISDDARFDVFCAPADEMPDVLREIGRLRELTFRQVGEGTGKPLDLDRFDHDYLHLFVWDRVDARIVGAYRLGPTDDIVRRRGVDGLYTHTLFAFDERLLGQFGPALELGRSFVVSAYQRTFAPLMLLWKGIGRFVVEHPKYRILFGAISISNGYDSMTRRLLLEFLRANNFDGDAAKLLRPRNPPRFTTHGELDGELLATTVRSIGEVDELVSDIEAGGRSMPVLLRQYLKLGGKLIGFNIDTAFCNVLDGLFYVDLTAVPEPILVRYMTRENAAAFRDFHGGRTRIRDAAQSESAGMSRSR